MKPPVRVLVVDDSAFVRQMLTEFLGQDPEITIVGSAEDPFAAREKILTLKPDVITLDINMPKMNGIEFLQRLMPHYPLPVIVVSSLTEAGCRMTLDALAAGALDFVTKPKGSMAGGFQAMITELSAKIKDAATADVSHWKGRHEPVQPKPGVVESPYDTSDHVLVIGASTGGTQAIAQILQQFPKDMIATVIVQHMPPNFTSMYAQRLDESCSMKVREAQDGDLLQQGLVLIAQGDQHLSIERQGVGYRVHSSPGEKVCGHCPSVEVLFQSAAKVLKSNATGVMLTGMGKDGAQGMLAMREQGAHTVAQNEESSVVFGMPRAAIEAGGAETIMHLDEIGEYLVSCCHRMTSSR